MFIAQVQVLKFLVQSTLESVIHIGFVSFCVLRKLCFSHTDSSTKFWDPNASKVYLTEAVKQDPNAMACGTKGFVLLHGLIAHEVANGAKFTSKIIVHRVPTYYGMMAAIFVKL